MDLIRFDSKDGYHLNGLLFSANQKTNKVMLAIHGMTSNCFSYRNQIIAEHINKKEIDYCIFNNRGHDIVSYITRRKEQQSEIKIAGTAYEDITESVFDIEGAIEFLLLQGYTDIYLQGHSLGCTKIVYSYEEFLRNRNQTMLQPIKAILLLSLIDIPGVQKIYLGDKFDSFLELAKKRKEKNELMPKESFIHPISARTYLRYFKDNESIQFANYSEKSNFKELNNISIPLFMRWGNLQELIVQDAEELCNLLRKKITNPKLDVGYIEGANHNYSGKEIELAKQINIFIEKLNENKKGT